MVVVWCVLSVGSSTSAISDVLISLLAFYKADKSGGIDWTGGAKWHDAIWPLPAEAQAARNGSIDDQHLGQREAILRRRWNASFALGLGASATAGTSPSPPTVFTIRRLRLLCKPLYLRRARVWHLPARSTFDLPLTDLPRSTLSSTPNCNGARAPTYPGLPTVSTTNRPLSLVPNPNHAPYAYLILPENYYLVAPTDSDDN